MNSYLIQWDFGYGSNGSFTVSSTAELLDFFDMRLPYSSGDSYKQSEGLDCYSVYPLAGSTNPYSDEYEVFKVANERVPGTVPEAGFPLSGIWMAWFTLEDERVEAFGTSPEHAVDRLIEGWQEYCKNDWWLASSKIIELRGDIEVLAVKAGSAFAIGTATETQWRVSDLKGDDNRFDQILEKYSDLGALAP